MRKYHTFILLALSTMVAPGLFAQDGWISLFNGKDLSGWTQKTGNARYSVQDGVIVGETVVPGGGTNSFLCTDKEYDDFILEVAFKVEHPKLNSGVQIRSHRADQVTKIDWKGRTITVQPGYVYGYQVEIDADVPRARMWSGGIYDERRRLWLYPGQMGGTAEAFSTQGNQIFKSGDWNLFRIEAIGDSIKTCLNGTPCADINDFMTPSGIIGLQVHQSSDEALAGKRVWFKDIRIKPIPANTVSAEEQKAGWRMLWDGKTTKGWRSARAEGFPQKGWEIRDGMLIVQPNNGAESAGGGDIITIDRYSDFELSAEFKLTPGANSGIKYFVQPNLDPITGSGAKAAVGSAIGLEYQVLDDALHPDAKLGRDGNRTLGSVYDLKAADAGKQPNPIGQWNLARILVRGNHVEYRLNGEKILEYDRGTPEFRQLVAQSKYSTIPGFGEWPDGHILLQEHGNQVFYRNIKIRVPSKP